MRIFLANNEKELGEITDIDFDLEAGDSFWIEDNGQRTPHKITNIATVFFKSGNQYDVKKIVYIND